MSVVYHPDVQKDASKILRHYDSINPGWVMSFGRSYPSSSKKPLNIQAGFIFQSPGRRRVNLQRFPYHFLFREIAGGIRVTVVRSHKQHPTTGTKRR